MIWCGWLITVAVLLQSIEMLAIQPYKWDLIKSEVPLLLRPLINNHRRLVMIRMAAGSIALFSPDPISVVMMWLTTWGLALRWRGTFNGGSDFMTFHILFPWWVSLTWPQFERACLYYIAIMVLLSYFVAGLVKVIRMEWLNGRALQEFLSRYGHDLSLRVALVVSGLVLVFELLSPLALIFPTQFVVLAFLFHLANFYFFGLNRFVFAWLAAYPTIFMVARDNLLSSFFLGW